VSVAAPAGTLGSVNTDQTSAFGVLFGLRVYLPYQKCLFLVGISHFRQIAELPITAIIQRISNFPSTLATIKTQREIASFATCCYSLKVPLTQ